MDLNHRNCWFHLLPEILDRILLSLGLRDCLTFGKVCRSWRSVFVERRKISHPPPCMSGFPDEFAYRDHELEFSKIPILGLHRGQIRRLRSPRLGILHSEEIIASSIGWLVVVPKEKSGLYLMNPTSNLRISLPSLTTCGMELRWHVYSCNNSCFKFRDVVASMDPTFADCLLVAMGVESFVWCKLSHPAWSIYHLQVQDDIKNMVFHREELYILNDKDDIMVYSFVHEPKVTKLNFISPNTNQELSWWRLVASCGDLLAVLYHMDKSESISSARVYVYKLEDSRWVRMESLVDRVLLISKQSTLSFSTKDLIGSSFESNCIYFRPGDYIVRYSMVDGTKKRIHLPGNDLQFEFFDRRMLWISGYW